MDSTATANEVTATPEVEWSEAHLESSMAQLQEMHARLCKLRDAVSRLIDPMLFQQSSPEELYNDFARNVNRTQADVQELTRLVRSERSKEIFERAAESRAQNSGDIRGWRVTEHEDWLDVRGPDVPTDVNAVGTTGPNSDSSPRTSIEDLRAAIEQFKNNHPGINSSLDETSKTMMINLPPPGGIRFRVAINLDSTTQSTFVVTCSESSSMHATILQHINNIARNCNPDVLLGILASYVNFQKTPCSRCRRLLDRNAQFPLLRVDRSSGHHEGRTGVQWQPLHLNCV
ncbi:MAG: hypothetical protein LQ339_002871 [Xanthoria mediterranea]|nr:MAG: hypothetical protein LQ339_002871 [Xanthoria mediterranea]